MKTKYKKGVKSSLVGLFTAIIASASILSVAPISAEILTVEENQVTDNVLIYEKVDGGYTVVGCDSTIVSVSIPESLNGYSIVSIAEGAFYGCTKITSISVPDTVKTIGDGAFSSCTALTEITLPSELEVLPTAALANCYSLLSIDLPETLVSIGEGAFYGCSQLSEIDIPSSVTDIGAIAFNSCYYITSLELPKSLENLGEGALGGLAALSSLTIEEGNTNFVIDENILYNKDKTTLYSVTDRTIEGEINIPDTVLSIEPYAFSGCINITKVSVPSKITAIKEYTFSYCSALTNINLEEGLETIGQYAFFYADALESVTIPTTVKTIDIAAFAANQSLKTVTIPEGVTTVNSMAFFDCGDLKNVNLPNSVETLGDYAFGFSSNEDGSAAVLIDGFSMSVFSGSAGEVYAKTNNITFDTTDTNIKKIAFIVGCAVILIVTVAVAIRLIKKNSGVKSEDTVEQSDEVVFEDGYTSIVDEDDTTDDATDDNTEI